MTINVTIYNEFVHEKKNEFVGKIYPEGIHGAIGNHLKKEGDLNIQYATLDMPEHGLTEEVLNNTDRSTERAILVVSHFVQQRERFTRIYRVRDGRCERER